LTLRKSRSILATCYPERATERQCVCSHARTLFRNRQCERKVIWEGRPDEITRLVTFQNSSRHSQAVDGRRRQTSIEGNIKWRKLSRRRTAPEFWQACLKLGEMLAHRVDALDNIS